MTRKTDIVVTTIFEPAWLDGYLADLRAADRVDDVTIRIICDRKTPSSVYEAAAVAERQGFRIDCPSLDEQSAYLSKLGADDDFIPWNTDNRRNVGFLRAWEDGAEVLISIDDDNYCPPGTDFVGAHHVVGSSAADLTGQARSTDSPWFNICDLLEVDTASTIYARGFPYSARSQTGPATVMSLDDACVAINAGLWVSDPDVDAISRLAIAPHVTGVKGEDVVLGSPTWSPINTQNTALIRDAIPAYYYVRMGFELEGMAIDRFGDILSGYFVQKCAKHLGDVVRLGTPVLEHKRTPHNLFKDLHAELAGIVVLEDLLPWLRDVPLAGSDYSETYADLAARLREQAPRFRGFIWDSGGREFLEQTAGCMDQWLGIVRRIGAA